MAATAAPQRATEFLERKCCPACKSEKTETIFVCAFTAPPISDFIRNYYHRDPEQLAGWNYHLERCVTCACVYQKWYGDDAFLTELYELWLKGHIAEDMDTYAPWLRILEKPWQSRDAQELMMVSRYLGKPLRELKTFDFGMGFGLWAQISKLVGCDSYGFDLSKMCR